MLICQDCLTAPASILKIDISDTKVNTIILCVECAKKKGITVNEAYQLNNLPTKGLTLNMKAINYISNNLDNINLDEEFDDLEEDDNIERKDEVGCPNCGLTLNEFRLSRKLGCLECYVSFYDYLGDIIRGIHGSNTHCGEGHQDKQISEKIIARKINYLQNKMQQAIEEESFEQAAKLRDKIRVYERTNK